MKAIFKLIYSFFLWVDKVTGNYKKFSGETAPYCGHAYWGHKGFFTYSDYNEVNGVEETKGNLLRFGIHEDEISYCYSPLFIKLKNIYSKLYFKIAFRSTVAVFYIAYKNYHKVMIFEYKKFKLTTVKV